MDPLSTHFNNPGAIIPGDKITYEGMLGTDPKSGLAIFDTPENGRKALEKDLGIKLGRGVDTPEKFARAYLGPKADQQEVDNYAIAIADSFGFDATDTKFPENALPHLANTVTAVEAGTKRPTLQDADLPQADRQTPSLPPEGSGWGYEPPKKTQHDVDFERGQAQIGGGLAGAGIGTIKYPAIIGAKKLYEFAFKTLGRPPVNEEEAVQVIKAAIESQKPSSPPPFEPSTSERKSAEPLKAGDKWGSKIGGPGGETVTEAAGHYRTQRDLPADVAAKFRVNRSGVLLPLDVNNPISLPEDQRMQRAAEFQKQQITSETPSIRQGMIERQKEAARMLENRPEYVQQTKAQRVVNNVLMPPVKAGSFVLRSAPVRGGITTASILGNAADLQNALETGDTTGAALAGTGMAGGLASFVPKLNPVAGLLTGGADTARRVREGDTSGAAVSGGATLAPWAMRALLGARVGTPAGVVSMGAPMLYDAIRYNALQRAKEEAEAFKSPKDAAAYFQNLAPWER